MKTQLFALFATALLATPAFAWITDSPDRNIRITVFTENNVNKVTFEARNFPNCDLSFAIHQDHSSEDFGENSFYTFTNTALQVIECDAKKVANFSRTYDLAKLPQYEGGVVELPTSGTALTHRKLHFIFQATGPSYGDSGMVQSETVALVGYSQEMPSTTKRYIYFRYPLPTK